MHNTEILNDKPKQQQQIISNKKQQTQIDQNTIMNETKSNLTIILHWKSIMAPTGNRTQDSFSEPRGDRETR